MKAYIPWALPMSFEVSSRPSVNGSSIMKVELKAMTGESFALAILTAVGFLPLRMSWKKKWGWVVFSMRFKAMASETSSEKVALVVVSEVERRIKDKVKRGKLREEEDIC